jgi:hypothetical protein
MKTNNNNTTPNNNNTKSANNAKKFKRVKNWSEYNNSLVNRGNISIYVSEAIASNVFAKPQPSHKAGHPIEYRDDLILFMLTIRELLHLPLRQAVGFVTGLLQGMGLSWQLPDYSTLSRRMSKLDIDFCRNFRGKNVVLLLDSSGFKVFGEGEWKVRKHGHGYRRTWRATHVAVDFETRNIIGLINTSSSVHDNTQLKPLLDKVRKKHTVATIIGDGAYDAKANYLIAKKQGIRFIAPPRKDATEHINMYHYHIYDKPGWEERNQVIRRIDELGIDSWKEETGYHRRSLVENTFCRLKTSFGGNLKSRTKLNQYTEQCIRASLINWFNEIGLPRYAT